MFPTLLFDADVHPPALLQRRALKAASGLAAMGVQGGDVVAVMLRNEPAAIEVLLATRHLGAFWCGLNWHFKAAEARWILEDSRAKVLVIHADMLETIAEGIPPNVQVLVVAPEPLTRAQYGIEPRLTAPTAGQYERNAWLESHEESTQPAGPPRGYMPYTSGTTGRPKGVKRFAPAPDKVAALMEVVGKLSQTVFGIRPDSRCLLAAPLYHSAPASYAIFCAQAGATPRRRYGWRWRARRSLRCAHQLSK